MEKGLLIKYGEIAIKGNNRRLFEKQLALNIKECLQPMGEFWIAKEQGRLFVEAPGEDWSNWTDEAAARISKVFGVIGICIVDVFSEDSFESISANVNRYIQENYGGQEATTFKVEVKLNSV